MARCRERSFLATGLVIVHLLASTEGLSSIDYISGGTGLHKLNHSHDDSVVTGTSVRRDYLVLDRRRASLCLLCRLSGADLKLRDWRKCYIPRRDRVHWLSGSAVASRTTRGHAIARTQSRSLRSPALNSPSKKGLDLTAVFAKLGGKTRAEYSPRLLTMTTTSSEHASVDATLRKSLGDIALAAPRHEVGSNPPDLWLTPPHVLSSNPIERFSGKHEVHINRSLSVVKAIPSNIFHLIGDVRPRKVSGMGQDAKSGRSLHQEDIGQGLQKLCAAIVRVEDRLGTDASGSAQLREALRLLRTEKEVYSRELANELARLESIAREYHEMRRKVAVTKGDLSRNYRSVARVEKEREKSHVALSERLGHLMSGLGGGKVKIFRDIGVTKAGQEGKKGAGNVVTPGEINHAYDSRVHALSNGMIATQDQLTRLKSDRNRERGEAEKIRKQLTEQVVQLEAQLKGAVQGVKNERADMESVLQRLLNALSSVDMELVQSEGMAPSRDFERALQRVRGRFRSDRRGIKLLLERQKHRYFRACQAIEEEAQQLRLRMTELNSLKAKLALSADKEKALKSSVSTLSGKVFALDKELRQTRNALNCEKILRCKAEAELLSSEQRRKQETASLRRELEATQETMATTRKVYESAVGQRQRWQRALSKEARAKTEADERANSWELTLRDEVASSKRFAARLEGEIADLKAQVVRASRSLSLSEAEKRTQTRRLERKIKNLSKETKRLKSQAADGKKAVARTVTGVSSRAFLNFSQMSHAMAPQGLLAKLGDRLHPRPRNSDAIQDPGSTEASPAPRPSAGVGWAGNGILVAGSEASDNTKIAHDVKNAGEGGGGAEGAAEKGTPLRRMKETSTRQKEMAYREDRTSLGAIDGSDPYDDARRGDSAAAVAGVGGHNGSLPGAGSRGRVQLGAKKYDGEAKATAGSSPPGTAAVTSSSKPRRQKALNRFEQKLTSTTKRSTTKYLSEKSDGNRDLHSGTDVQSTSTRPRHEYSSSTTGPRSSPEKTRPENSSGLPRGAPSKTPASAAANALREVSRAVFRGGSVAVPGISDDAPITNGTSSIANNSQGRVLEEGQQGSGDGRRGSRRSQRSRDSAGRMAWYGVDILNNARAPRSAWVAAPTVQNTDRGVGDSRGPWARLVRFTQGRDKNGSHSTGDSHGAPPAVIASTLAATSHDQNVTENGNTETRAEWEAPESGLQLHFIGVGG